MQAVLGGHNVTGGECGCGQPSTEQQRYYSVSVGSAGSSKMKLGDGGHGDGSSVIAAICLWGL